MLSTLRGKKKRIIITPNVPVSNIQKPLLDNARPADVRITIIIIIIIIILSLTLCAHNNSSEYAIVARKNRSVDAGKFGGNFFSRIHPVHFDRPAQTPFYILHAATICSRNMVAVLAHHMVALRIILLCARCIHLCPCV